MQHPAIQSTQPPPRIVFLVMSAVAKPGTVDQLARSLAPHLVLVHHDFSQTRDFELSAPNVRFVPDPKRTGWAYFGFVDGIFHSLQYALEHLEFDYLQLLSPSCLPIKSMESLEAHVRGPAEAHFDCVDLFGDRDAFMSVGYRALTPEGSLRHRLARHLSSEYFGANPRRRDEAGIWLRSGGGTGAAAMFALAFMKALSLPMVGQHIFGRTFRPYYGSTWFGARRHVVAGMVAGFQKPGVRDYFSRLCIAEEFLIPTLLMHMGVHKGPMNHFINEFHEAHPREIDPARFERLRSSEAFFARKFPDNPASPIRRRVLAELAGQGPVSHAHVRDPRTALQNRRA